MAERGRRRRPGIIGLLTLIDEHQEAVEYDLITHGVRLRDLGTDRLSWRDLKIIVKQQPGNSALARAINGDDYLWDIHAQLAALIVDHLAVGNWQRSGDKRAKRPKPVERPGHRPERFGREPIPMDAMADWLGWNTETLAPEEPDWQVYTPNN